MRNDIFLAAYAEKICDFNFNKAAQEKVEKFIPKTEIYARTAMKNWMEQVKLRMPRLKEKQKEHPEVLSILDEYERTFFFEGHEEYFEKLLNTDTQIVLAHHDAQENNILSSLEDSTKIILIDFEYVGWAPRAMDIANYCNETMLENAYPLKNGIKYYLQNFIKESELEFLVRQYLTRYFNLYFEGDKSNLDLKTYLSEEVPKLIQETH